MLNAKLSEASLWKGWEPNRKQPYFVVGMRLVLAQISILVLVNRKINSIA